MNKNVLEEEAELPSDEESYKDSNSDDDDDADDKSLDDLVAPEEQVQREFEEA